MTYEPPCLCLHDLLYATDDPLGTDGKKKRRLRKKKMSLSRLANGALSPSSKSRGKGKGKGRCSSPVRPAISAAARSLADEVAGARGAEEETAEGGNAIVGNPAVMQERRPQQGAGIGAGSGAGASASDGAFGQPEGVRRGKELGEQEEEEEEEGGTEGEADEANQLEEEEVAGLLVGSLTAATSERRALSLDDLKDLFR